MFFFFTRYKYNYISSNILAFIYEVSRDSLRSQTKPRLVDNSVTGYQKNCWDIQALKVFHSAKGLWNRIWCNFINFILPNYINVIPYKALRIGKSFCILVVVRNTFPLNRQKNKKHLQKWGKVRFKIVLTVTVVTQLIWPIRDPRVLCQEISPHTVISQKDAKGTNRSHKQGFWLNSKKVQNLPKK